MNSWIRSSSKMKGKLLGIIQTGTALALVLFCVFQIYRMISAFVARQVVEKNPLVPDYLETGIRNYIIFFTVIYLLVATANIWSWYMKRYFYIVTAASFMVIIGIQLTYLSIVDFFLKHLLP